MFAAASAVARSTPQGLGLLALGFAAMLARLAWLGRRPPDRRGDGSTNARARRNPWFSQPR